MEWKDIKGWESIYEICDQGYVRNKKTNRILSGDKNSAGYCRVCLYDIHHVPRKERFFVHRLVAKHFIPNPENLREVNHKDCDKLNNSIENLEWIDRTHNELHSRITGSKEFKPFEVVFMNGVHKTYLTKPMLAKELGVTRATVRYWLRKMNSGFLSYGIKQIKYI